MDKKKILVVDDEKECCELLKDFFTKYDYLVDIISNPKEVEKLLDSKKYEYIIFDYSMPGFSGVELAKVLKKKNPEAKRILISGYDAVDDATSQAIGAHAFLRKPFVIEDLRMLIENT